MPDQSKGKIVVSGNGKETLYFDGTAIRVIIRDGAKVIIFTHLDMPLSFELVNSELAERHCKEIGESAGLTCHKTADTGLDIWFRGNICESS